VSQGKQGEENKKVLEARQIWKRSRSFTSYTYSGGLTETRGKGETDDSPNTNEGSQKIVTNLQEQCEEKEGNRGLS